MSRRRSLLSGAIKESRLARAGRGLIQVQNAEGGNKGGDSRLNFGGGLKVKGRRRDEAAREI